MSAGRNKRLGQVRDRYDLQQESLPQGKILLVMTGGIEQALHRAGLTTLDEDPDWNFDDLTIIDKLILIAMIEIFTAMDQLKIPRQMSALIFLLFLDELESTLDDVIHPGDIGDEELFEQEVFFVGGSRPVHPSRGPEYWDDRPWHPDALYENGQDPYVSDLDNFHP